MTKVSNLISSNGNSVANQFNVTTDKGRYFQSYSSVIAFKAIGGKVQLDSETWNFSRTTAKYRNQWLEETTQETQAKIDSGEYVLTNLNK